MQARDITANGVPYPITWLDATPGRCEFRSRRGQISSRSRPLILPVGRLEQPKRSRSRSQERPSILERSLVIKEIMYRPSVEAASLSSCTIPRIERIRPVGLDCEGLDLP